MKKTRKPAAPPNPAKAPLGKKHPALLAPNATLNNQNRRVLAQHYRAKYGVK